jgi:hypothetical protein
MTAIFALEGCTHGFLTLGPDTDILLYLMGRQHIPGHARVSASGASVRRRGGTHLLVRS